MMHKSGIFNVLKPECRLYLPVYDHMSFIRGLMAVFQGFSEKVKEE